MVLMMSPRSKLDHSVLIWNLLLLYMYAVVDYYVIRNWATFCLLNSIPVLNDAEFALMKVSNGNWFYGLRPIEEELLMGCTVRVVFKKCLSSNIEIA